MPATMTPRADQEFSVATGVRLLDGGHRCPHWLKVGRCAVRDCDWWARESSRHRWWDHPRRGILTRASIPIDGETIESVRVLLTEPYGFDQASAADLTAWCAQHGFWWEVAPVGLHGHGTIPLLIAGSRPR